MAKTANKKWKTETRSAAKRVLIGVTTAVTTSAVIYFLGFGRPEKKADELEVKKNTIQVWKDFVKLENGLQPKHDSLFAQSARNELTAAQYRERDSLISADFIREIKILLEKPDIDNDMQTILRSRIQFKEEELHRFQQYMRRFVVLRDTLTTTEYRNFLIQELNTQFVGARDNAAERLGRSLENMLQFLQKKYKYPFQVKDLVWYERYLELKSVRQAEIKPDADLPGM